jgi:nicotinate-nucleotide adenylyltransferase
VEIDRPGPHFTIDTVRLLQEQNPGAQLFYLMGGDSLHDLPTWMRPRELVACLAGIGVLRRPQDFVDMPWLERALPGITAKVNFIDAPLLEISSSDIRQRITEGRHYRYFLQPAVFELLKQKRLYTERNRG